MNEPQWQDTPTEPGYYWCYLKGSKPELNVAYFYGTTHNDGSTRRYPINLFGSDEPFAVDEFLPKWLRIPEPVEG